MTFARASFTRLNVDLSLGERLEVQYNPTEFSFTKSVQYAEVGIPGLNAPIQQFVRGNAETVSVELFFDTTEFGTAGDPKPVTLLTDQFYQLIRVDPHIKAPPICLFSWSERGFPGSNLKQGNVQLREHGFRCLVESVMQKFTLFSPEGIPLRAMLTVKLREYQTLTDLVTATEQSVTLIEDNTTLDEIANRAFNDPTRWRDIAELNNIDDPLELRPGSILNLPE
jgi:nucleoid-associated protein YgaU